MGHVVGEGADRKIPEHGRVPVDPAHEVTGDVFVSFELVLVVHYSENPGGSYAPDAHVRAFFIQLHPSPEQKAFPRNQGIVFAGLCLFLGNGTGNKQQLENYACHNSNGLHSISLLLLNFRVSGSVVSPCPV